MSEASALVQFYAPLVGLVGLAFWTGRLSMQVQTMGREIRDLKIDGSGEHSPRERLVRLETQLENLTGELGKANRALEGVQRQLAGIASRGAGGRSQVIELGGAQDG